MTRNRKSLEGWEGTPVSERLRNVVVVLDETQDLVNIAGVVRAMRNMGLRRLRLVRPVEFDPWRITGIAHRCEEIVQGAERMDSLDEALASASWIVGTSNRARTAHRNYVRPRERAPGWLARAEEGTVALLFGREDRGLSNEALDRCHEIAVIPTDPEYPSLNLAQAFLLLGYELHLAAQEEQELPLPRGRRSTGPATAFEMERMYGAIQRGLDAMGFFHARTPEGVMRTVRTALGRASLDDQEAGVFGAIGYGIGKYARRLQATIESGTPPPEDEVSSETHEPDPDSHEEDGSFR